MIESISGAINSIELFYKNGTVSQWSFESSTELSISNLTSFRELFDRLFAGNDRLEGSSGDDTLVGGAGVDSFDGAEGNDTVSYYNATSNVTVKLGNAELNSGASTGETYASIENITGSRFNDKLSGAIGRNVIGGGAGIDDIYGDRGYDMLFGGAGNDLIRGGTGKDTLVGGEGRDTLIGGGNTDTFVFEYASHSTVLRYDTIMDFNADLGDRIKVPQHYRWKGTDEFSSSHNAQLRYEQVGADTFVYGDANGDGEAELAIKLIGMHPLTLDDFILF